MTFQKAVALAQKKKKKRETDSWESSRTKFLSLTVGWVLTLADTKTIAFGDMTIFSSN